MLRVLGGHGRPGRLGRPERHRRQAKDLEFSPTEVSAPADAPFEIVFDNQEGVPHNMAISDSTGTNVFKGEIVSSRR